ncbi:MAG: HsdR family type I site-specific deoxyribonuclease [Gammaproteobacteria bacterium]|nr:HsdR family type I site-specific deoxyribonuclease [Gammaproteobacteria bacterium]MYA67889.1 HsdR family type I site-specific deoxyribonuclease [Gammaproteobacteria bacterium]MYE28702.1 HsdR family type I site-specific deoxyribonuclease [Gammaproteobacteria bacterium]MYH45651.1 HsdR family type I site-specific deoxyribonuclease [Gammaproteobacteria bacterium]MYL13285.1 HsdR family type I site-specific deoxyribonuclease [Gammaproteobacteria bacterium]
MTTVGEREIETQRRVVRFFQDALGYGYLGDWTDRPGNANIEQDILSSWLRLQGHNDRITSRVIELLRKAASVGGVTNLYDANREVYGLLRYGVKVQPKPGEHARTIWLIDWENPDNNDFAIAEEVTVEGAGDKRPDVVLYVNGIALGVLELKRSIVSLAEGIRQNLDNQKPEFIRPFFATAQLLMAGNETEGLRYSVIETPEKYWLRWKESEAHPDAGDNLLLKELGQLCGKERLLEIVHDFMVFDAGIKKTCRHNQYFGVKAAQEHVANREGGIVWHTQGSGKSLLMVWLAKWVNENVNGGRVLIVTDRKELDEQIEKVFKGVNEDIYRTGSGADLVSILQSAEQWLIASLIHKFGSRDEASERDIDGYIAEIKKHLPKGFRAKGEIFVFVDECHRTQSGKLHKAMKTLLPEATLIGFTGTPLLKSDKARSIEIFGPYIHTYKYDEAVRDKVVLDLRYEARDIDQDLTSEAKVDQWFDAKTAGLTDLAKAQLKQRWGTMRAVMSAEDRLRKIVADIALDMETRDRLKSGHGNALLISDSIHSACRLYEMFNGNALAGKCAIVTSYQPSKSKIKGEETGEGLTEKLRKYDIYRKMLAEHFDEPEDKAMRKVEQFEKDVKKRFIEEPGKMKLLIVVDKLLTGFDAPSATVLYIDKKMQDHGLFQAICRVNRLDREDKEYGYIVDYKDLFRSLEKSISDYTGEAFEAYDREDVAGLLKNRLEQAREQLEEAREAVKALCEPVEPPKDSPAYFHYFCATDSGDAGQLKANEPKRLALYKMAAAYLRTYADLANEMDAAGYSAAEARTIRDEVDHYEKVRSEVKLASGDYIDLKVYEPAMRHLLDTYIRAGESEKISAFDDLPLVELILERGTGALDSLPDGIRGNREAMAETIENNVRRLIIDEMAVNPRYYEHMSTLLEELIAERKRQALDYQAYLAKIVALTGKVRDPDQARYPQAINSPARQAIFDLLQDLPELGATLAKRQVADPGDTTVEIVTLRVDDAIRKSKMADFRGHPMKEKKIRNAIKNILPDDDLVDQLFEIVKAQREY